MQAIGIAIPSGEAIHRDKAPDGRIQVARPQIIKTAMTIKELACKKMSICCGSSFVKQIPKGIVIVGIGDGFTAGGKGSRAAKSIIVIIRGHATAGLRNEVVPVHIAHQQISAAVAFFQDLRVVSVAVHQISGHNRAIDHLTNAAALGIILVFNGNGDAEASGFNAGQVILGVIEPVDLLMCVGFLEQVAAVKGETSERKGENEDDGLTTHHPCYAIISFTSGNSLLSKQVVIK